jgi:RimJ/RimL family protein N-acetyltransferase
LHLDGPLPFTARNLGPALSSTPPPPNNRSELPEIETPRLRLRVYRPDDLPAVAAIMSRPETFLYSERGPMNADEAWARLLRHYGHWSLFGYGLFAVEEKRTGSLIGEVGFADFKRGFGRDFDSFPEASWTLAPHVWGRAYAWEAATAAHDWLMTRRQDDETVCMIHRGNARSIRLAARLGYRPYAERRYCGYDAWLFRRSAD